MKATLVRLGGLAHRVLPVLVAAVVIAAGSSAFAQTTPAFTMPTELAPGTLVTSLLTDNKDYILVGAGAIVGLTLLVGLVRGLARKSAHIFR